MNEHNSRPNEYPSEEDASMNNLQKPNIYNQHLPFHDHIESLGFKHFNEILENLSRSIQMFDLVPSFTIWTHQLLDFLQLYGYYFSKTDHIKLINFYISVLSITDLDYFIAKLCFEVLRNLLCKPYLITRDDITIDWRIFYSWTKRFIYCQDEQYSLVVLPKDIQISLEFCVNCCCAYFSTTATQEMLDEFRPRLCPFDIKLMHTMKICATFLPVQLPPESHHQGFKLWLTEFLGIWDCMHNNKRTIMGEFYMVNLFASTAWNHIGYIDWEPWILQIFTRILNSFSLPVGKASSKYTSGRYIVSDTARWIVAMIGNESSCIRYLGDLLIAMKIFFHQSSTGNLQRYLIEFILKLTEYFLKRIRLERKTPLHWDFIPKESHRLTEQDIVEFVNCIKDYVFIIVSNSSHIEDVAKTLRYLSVLQPALIIPSVIERLFLSIDNMTEPDRFTMIMKCIPGIARQLVTQTPSYSENQTFVLPLLTAILPGVSSNDQNKTKVTLEVLYAILKLVPCIDCSSAVQTRHDLTEVEQRVCLSTAQFEDFVIDFLNRVFQIVSLLSVRTFDSAIDHISAEQDDPTIGDTIVRVMDCIVKQCSENIFQSIRRKFIDFIDGSLLPPNARGLVVDLAKTIAQANPVEILRDLLPKTCEHIMHMMDDSQTDRFVDTKVDLEFGWYWILFSQLVWVPGDALVIYKQMIISVFQRCMRIIQKDAYQSMADAIENLLKTLLTTYPTNDYASAESIDEACLPIRTWGKPVDFNHIKIKYHHPSADEIKFAWDFVNTFLHTEIQFLNEKCLQISNEERLRSLTMIEAMATGCLGVIPRVESAQVAELPLTAAPLSSKHGFQYSIYVQQADFTDNLRTYLLTNMENVLDKLIENHSDDVASIKMAISIYSSLSLCHGTTTSETNYLSKRIVYDDCLFRHEIYDQRESPLFLVIKKTELQLKKFQKQRWLMFTEFDKRILLRLFQLSLNRYSEIRRRAQDKMFLMFDKFALSYYVIVDPLNELLTRTDNADHDQIKACLYILLGDSSVFLLTKYSWTTIEKLWPTFIRINHKNKTSLKKLIDNIHTKLHKEFASIKIINSIDDPSMNAIIALWQRLEVDEVNLCEQRNRSNLQSYNNVMEKLSLLLTDDKLTWGQHTMSIKLMCLLLQKHVPIPISSIRAFANMLNHDSIEIRKHAIIGVAALCHLQKIPRMPVAKPLSEIIGCSTTLDRQCCPGDRADNKWVTTDNVKFPQTQNEWEETCFIDPCYPGYYKWPDTIGFLMNKRTVYSRETMPEQVAIIYDRFMDKNFVIQLTKLRVLDNDKETVQFDKTRYSMFKCLFRNFGIVLVYNFIEPLYELIRETELDKQEGSHRTAAEIVAGIIRGSKCWTLEMLEELWKILTPFLTELSKNVTLDNDPYWGWCFQYSIENQDPRRLPRLIEFLSSLMDNITTTGAQLNKTSRLYLVQMLDRFQWRIPSSWHILHDRSKELLDHPFESVRSDAVDILAKSVYFDVVWPNGESTRHPTVSQLMKYMVERLHDAIEIYKSNYLVHLSDRGVELNSEARQALNIIEAVILLHKKIFNCSFQPMKNETIHLFPYLCEIESIAVNHESIGSILESSRLSAAEVYLHADLLEAFVEQLENVCQNPKWHARRAAIEFMQKLFFSNLFNSRSCAQRLNKLLHRCLFDEQIEVRTTAAITLSGFYQCGYIQVTCDDLKYFETMSKTICYPKVKDKNMARTENLAKVHGGILGLCAIVLSSPYDISPYVPAALILLCKYTGGAAPVRSSINDCLSAFRHTHHHEWNEHKQKFTTTQLEILSEVYFSSNYFV